MIHVEGDMKKNCRNCQHLEWVESECVTGYGSGFDCNKRHDQMENQGREDELLANLDRDEYLDKAKVCHEPKVA